ncbi:unnamed protein product, partial [Owenia fusiformis]
IMKRVIVIGAGAAGLCALRHLTARPDLFQAVAYEQSSVVGGTWVYTEQTDKDDRGNPIHSSMYKELRTNLPKEVMAFPDFPFDKSLPSFVRHSDVRKYLEDYTQQNDLYKYIKFNTSVEHVDPIKTDENDIQWEVTVKDNEQGVTKETADAVMVCNGHYSTPIIPNIKGMDDFKGKVLHSHNYRHKESCQGLNVVCLGAGASGQDIGLEVASAANKVYLSHNKAPLLAALPSNMVQVPGISHLKEHSVVFKDEKEVPLDLLLLCTGYHYTFPFLSEKCHIDTTDERVSPLYKHLIHTEFPTLALMGLCKTICPFPQFDCQVRFFISSLDGSMVLPSAKEMRKDTNRDFEWRAEELNMPARHAHHMGKLQWEYNDELAYLGNFTPIPQVIRMLYDAVHQRRFTDIMLYKKDNYELVGPKEFKPLIK